ncbi:PREDICTED: uncharacterized protein LOC104815364 [Tarenaya hassleriana]|uniref:uncharacterized protein LOC104815364 n=1 Tax=Tarenaya hassleriana TaxID=28532 RepID=UPI00053C27E5|nr:PREDICTED: uncharacterized protein LOC104815364 [Tarenaya hassleriana]
METTTTDDISDDDDGSISDEESLIELSLPSGHYLGNYGNDDNTIKGYSNKNKMYHKNIQDLRLFDQLLVEEDNLIEIDISIGSIKCSRFEIPA